ncbi:MAG: serine dehydratase subunit alpha family protein, partial [Clostridia bacterium]|nr:serine dehydratase subunit alpha family protein [Clostridia bacterium]
VAAGIIASCPERRLEVLEGITSSDHARIAAYCDSLFMELCEMPTDKPFDLDMCGTCGDITARVKITDRHTNVVLVERNGENLTDAYLCTEHHKMQAVDHSCLNVKDIVEFAETVPLDDLEPLLSRQLALNMAIAEEGITGDWGASIGKILLSHNDGDVRVRARAYAAAGSDARMSGCEMPVCIISGSGNQGMTASIPIAVYAQHLGSDRETLLRALIVSDLITVHQKTGIGCLSAYCGAISAGCGAGCGICYLDGGRFYEIAHTLVNSLAVLSGTICDGAKPSCAAKIAMAVEAGIMGYEMTRANKQFYGGDGIVTKGVENTIRNIGRLARDGMSETDKEIIKIMLNSV